MTRRGYTFIEMSVVILLLALLAAAITPRLLAMQASQRSYRYHADLRGLFQFAREDAIQSGQVRTVAYQDDTFRVTSDNADNASVLQSVPSVTGIQAGNFQADGSGVSDSEWALKFYPDGKAEPGQFALTEGVDETIYSVRRNGMLKVLDQGDDDSDQDRWPAGDSLSAN